MYSDICLSCLESDVSFEIEAPKKQSSAHEWLFSTTHTGSSSVPKYRGFHCWDTSIRAEFASHVFVTKELVFVISTMMGKRHSRYGEHNYFWGRATIPGTGSWSLRPRKRWTVSSAPVHLPVLCQCIRVNWLPTGQFSHLTATVSSTRFSTCLRTVAL